MLEQHYTKANPNTKEKPKPKDKEVRRKQLKFEGFFWNFEIVLNYDKNEKTGFKSMKSDKNKRYNNY